VLELEAGRARFFKGTWHQWRREQAARELALGRAIEKQQAEIARMESFIERFRAKATKARQAQSRVKQLDKIERITRDPRDRGRWASPSRRPSARAASSSSSSTATSRSRAACSSTTPTCGSSAAST
jgi:ATP-binding cassette subfamily F protein 3